MRALLVLIGLMVAAAPAHAAPPTFTKDVAPILFKSCVECHRPTGMAPMSLMTFDEARPWARAGKQKVVAREMMLGYYGTIESAGSTATRTRQR